MTDFLTAAHAARFILAAILGLALLISWLSSRAIDRWDHADDQRDGRALVDRQAAAAEKGRNT